MIDLNLIQTATDHKGVQRLDEASRNQVSIVMREIAGAALATLPQAEESAPLLSEPLEERLKSDHLFRLLIRRLHDIQSGLDNPSRGDFPNDANNQVAGLPAIALLGETEDALTLRNAIIRAAKAIEKEEYQAQRGQNVFYWR